jgi:hypothetical protein
MASQLMKKKVMLHAQSNGMFNDMSHGWDNLRRSGTPVLMVPGMSYGGVKCMGVDVVLATLQSHDNHHAGLFVLPPSAMCPALSPHLGDFFSC